jgi:ATP-dependent 26S proteasome regulatory subunit
MVISSRAAVAAYLHAMTRAFAPDSIPGRRLTDWLRLNNRALGLDFETVLRLPAPSTGQRARLPDDAAVPHAVWSDLSNVLARVAASATVDADPVARNFCALTEAVGLDTTEAAVFRFVFETDRDKAFEWLCNMLLGTRAVETLGLIAVGIGSDPTTVWSKLCGRALRGLELVKFAANASNSFSCYVEHRIIDALMPPNDGLADVERSLIGMPLRPQLGPEAFAHISKEHEFLRRLLGNASDRGLPGVNVLLHGNPGTGKTEYCRMLAAELGCALFSVGEADDWGGEPSRDERLAALRLADCLAARRGKTMLLFDEMEDLLRVDSGDGARRRRNTGSKIYMNRLLEQNRVPILWCSNGIEVFDPAFIRRMDYVAEMKPLPLGARQQMLTQAAAKNGLALGPEDAGSLARKYRVAPGLINTAVEAAATAGGGVPDLEFVAGSLARAVDGAPPARTQTPAPFIADFVQADHDLGALERALKQADATRDFSLVLFGPPGTGKSAFARHLAEAIELEPMFRRASDLLSKWIGETEQRLAAAFAEAREDRRFLIIDEAEPFLWNRSGASRSWEVSMVDEFLVQMENHSLPLACTTNLPDAVDSAALRRFTLKVKFDFLTADQAAGAYAYFFKRPAPRALKEVACLTPSDFTAVLKRCRLFGGTVPTDGELVELLDREVAAKHVGSRRIGF